MDINSISANTMYTNLINSLKPELSKQNVEDDTVIKEKMRCCNENVDDVEDLAVTNEKMRCCTENLIGSIIDVYVD